MQKKFWSGGLALLIIVTVFATASLTSASSSVPSVSPVQSITSASSKWQQLQEAQQRLFESIIKAIAQRTQTQDKMFALLKTLLH